MNTRKTLMVILLTQTILVWVALGGAILNYIEFSLICVFAVLTLAVPMLVLLNKYSALVNGKESSGESKQ